MIQRLKEETWFKPVALTLGALSGTVLWSSIAGAIFLARFNQALTWALPLALYRYWYYYDSVAYVHRWIRMSGALATAAMLLPILAVYKPKKPSLYGDAKLAELRDLKKAGLLEGDGILIGRFKGRFLRIGGNRHVLLRAPTGEGKGVAVVTPNALTWKQSMIAFDLKGELLRLTSGFRAKFQPVFVFNPLSETYQTHRFNPLAYVPEDANLRINEIQKIANMFFPDRPNTDRIWTATPRSLFLGIALLLCETPGRLVAIGQVRRESMVDGDCAEYFERVIKERMEAGNPLSDECVRSLNVYTSIKADVTRAGIIAGFRAALELWANPLIDAATSANDFDLRTIRKAPMTIYLSITQDNLIRLSPLLTLFYQQLFDLNTRQELHQTPELKCACLMVQDERAALGQIDALDKGIAYLRSYGFSILSIFQSIGQMEQLLQRAGANNYASNHLVQIIYPPSPNETEDAEQISKAMGDITVKVKSPNGKGSTEQRRRLMLPQEVVGLESNRAIIMKRGMPPAVVEKIEYYSDEDFTERLLPPIAVPVIDVAAHNKMVIASSPQPRVGVVLAKPGEVVRPISAEDVPKLGNLALNDFVLNFSKVDPPASDTLDVEALHAYADMRCREAGITVE